ncbi:flagellar biosynthesis protein FliW [Azoarcus indigens]|uniref:Flagellar assembly factor FliW n=1 Tax=Azoarcus indigens TaxID=29545 RepID=A0A4R6E0S3_9RHOO|nr:flagellar assembly protein FliW [Azoarcus indigens]NMG66507.1 flagellar biosynthesis protein FliW [Azoarcus indigens]TDN51306.1 flagellar assembly factor FliW [Azoarcus indigens]
MKIESPVFGTAEIADDKVIEFPAGLPGFEGCHRFVVMHEAGSAAGVFLLQSVDERDVAFSITGPELLGVTYEFQLSDEEVELLQLKRPEDALVAIIIRKEDANGSPATAGLRANFMAPLVFNLNARRGLQKVINRLGCDIVLRAQG